MKIRAKSSGFVKYDAAVCKGSVVDDGSLASQNTQHGPIVYSQGTVAADLLCVGP